MEEATMKTSVVIMDKSRRLLSVSLILVGFFALPAMAVAGLDVKVPSTSASQLHGGHVMPPTAKPKGFSLGDMALENAQFTTSGNKPAFFPATPFQILYYDPQSLISTPVEGGGLLATGSNTFHVPTGTFFYVPIINVDDSLPVIGSFPTSPSMVPGYWFGSSQVGGSQFIEVDGQTTSLGVSYVVGPITTLPLQDGGWHTHHNSWRVSSPFNEG
jgi:hypothetical protein